MELLENTLGLSLIPTSNSTGSSSSTSMSTPITPLNVPVLDELTYPVDFASAELAPPTSGLTPEFGMFSQWINHDMDATPTLVGEEKGLEVARDV